MPATMSKLEHLAQKLEELHKEVQLQQPLGETVEAIGVFKDAFAEVRSTYCKRAFVCTYYFHCAARLRLVIDLEFAMCLGGEI